MNVRMQRVSPFYCTSQFADSEDFDFRVWFSPGFLKQLKIAAGALSLHRATKFIICLDFAVTLSSPDSFLKFFSTSLENTLHN